MTDFGSEVALLEAVRDRLRTELSLDEQECNIEFDEQVPAHAVRHKYIVVMPGGISKGAAHDGGHVIDEIIGVDVTVIIRATDKPRDRRRDIFLRNLSNLNEWCEKIRGQLDFNYTLLTAANTIINGDSNSTEGFVEPLRFAGMDPRARKVSGEVFDSAPTEPNAGLARTVRFSGARRIQSR